MKFLSTLKIKIDRFKFVFYFSFLSVIIENLFYFANRFTINADSGHFTVWQNLSHIIAEGLLAIVLVMLGLFIFALINRYLLKLVSIIILLISGALFYYVWHDKLIIDTLFMGAVMEPDSGEASAMINAAEIITWIIFGIIPAIYIAFFVKIKKLSPGYIKFYTKAFYQNTIKRALLFFFLPFFIVIGLILIFNYKIIVPVKLVKKGAYIYMPLNYISAGFNYFSGYLAHVEGNKGLINIYKKYPFTFEDKLKNKPLTIVLIIGESARVENEHYDGYKRNTNEFTEKIPNITYFKNMKSCGTFTRWSVPCMISRKGHNQFKLPTTETNLVTTFGDLGFKTWWISAQTSFIDSKDHNRVLANLVNAAQVQYFASSLYQSTDSSYNSHDELLLRFLKVALKDKAKHKFIVLHLRGSHFPYAERTPLKFQKFTKECKAKGCDEAHLEEAEYDDSLRYTDWFISQVINKIKNSNSLVLYAADHGESLKVDHSGYLLHGAPYNQAPYVQKHVASLMWFSKSMKKLLPQQFKSVKTYTNKKISHAYIFHSLFNCLDIKSSAVKPSLSLCSVNKKLKRKK